MADRFYPEAASGLEDYGGRSPLRVGASIDLVSANEIAGTFQKQILDFNAHEDYVGVLSIGLGVQSLLLPTGTTDRRASILGQAVWGTGGTNFIAEFDFHNGAMFTLNAENVAINATFSEITADTAVSVKLSASVAAGDRPARAQLTRTFPRELLTDVSTDPLNNVSFPVPNFAHALYIFSDTPDFYQPGAAEIRFTGGPLVGATYFGGDQAALVTDGSSFLAPMENEDGFRFPETARFIQIINNSSIDFNLTTMFTLSL